MPQNIDDFMDEISARVQQFARLRNSDAWRIRSEVGVYVNSEFKCPLCLKGLPTNLVYMVDEEHRRVLGCWTYPDMNPVGNFGKEAVHPHADQNGKLCMGNATNVAQLLFNGIGPGKHHRHTDTWLLMIGHECPNMTRAACIVCGVEMYRIEAVYYGAHPTCSEICSHLANKTTCYRCANPLGQGARGNRCAECFPIDAVPCMHCGDLVLTADIHYLGTNFYVCQECYDHRSRPCYICGEDTPMNEIQYLRCRQCQKATCVRCRGEYRKREMDDMGRCKYCRPKFHCPCGTQVSVEGATCETCTTESSRQQEVLAEGLPDLSESVIPIVVESDLDIFNEGEQ